MAKRKIKTEEEELRDFIIKTLRGAFRKHPLYSEAKKRAKVEVFELSKHGKPLRRVRYRCAECGGLFLDKKGAREIAVDHKDPVLSLLGWLGFDVYITRLFCNINNLQVLCNYKGEKDGKKACHKIKSALEVKKAAELRKRDSE